MNTRNAWAFACAVTLGVTAATFFSVGRVEARSPASDRGTYCIVEMPSASVIEEVEAALKGSPGGSDYLVIPVVFHVINQGAGIQNGDVPDSMLIDQVAALNNAFSGAAGGANTGFQFQLQSIDRTTNAAWYTAAYHSPEEYAMKEALRVGGASTLNIYTTASPWNWGGFPWGYAAAPLHDGVVMRHETLPGGGSQHFGTGDICVHEVGHWLGLYHTFQGECSPQNDFVADTPAMKAGGAQSCPSPRDTCRGKNYPGNDPLNNYMTGMIDSCANQFTAGQASRISSMWATYRQ